MDLCRDKGIAGIEVAADGAVKFTMGPRPLPKPKDGEADPRAVKRSMYFDQLGRILTDAELDLYP